MTSLIKLLTAEGCDRQNACNRTLNFVKETYVKHFRENLCDLKGAGA